MDKKKISHIQRLTLADLDLFLIERAKTRGARSLSRIATILRSFLNYLYLNRRISSDLAKHILSPSRFRSDLRPKYISWKKTQDLLKSVDRSTFLGKRNYAILRLLSDHGLRARELVQLKMVDIDWNNRSLLIPERKNGIAAAIPLSQKSLQALKDYLSLRPKCPYAEIFLTKCVPVRLLNTYSLSVMVSDHMRRCFGHLPHRGPYVLRHSFAKALLDRGARLSDIGILLGHKSLRSTLIYTRIATEDLREVAENYASLL